MDEVIIDDIPDTTEYMAYDDFVNNTWYMYPYIKTGYRRRYQDAKYYLQSLFWWNNETLNIWTHLLGAITFFILLFTTNLSSIMDGAYWADYVVINSFILSAFTCFSCSTLMHTFLPMNENVGIKLLKLDYFGISTMIIGSYTPFIYYSFYCHREIKLVYLGIFYFVGLIIIGLNCTKYFTDGENYRKRVILYALYGMLSIIPIIHRLIANYKNEGNYALELEYTLLAVLLYCIAIFFYVSHIPERWDGNKFAIYFSSHQIFHCFILMASLVQYTGIILTYYSEEGTICPIPFTPTQ